MGGKLLAAARKSYSLELSLLNTRNEGLEPVCPGSKRAILGIFQADTIPTTTDHQFCKSGQMKG